MNMKSANYAIIHILILKSACTSNAYILITHTIFIMYDTILNIYVMAKHINMTLIANARTFACWPVLKLFATYSPALMHIYIHTHTLKFTADSWQAG